MYLGKKIMMWIVMQRSHSPSRTKPSIDRLDLAATSETVIGHQYVIP